ncbi:MAG: iron-containing alcohol dehydrogenase [Desulfobacterales bacterium]|nr:iron-containing alcohol dehydrogenase [Desulfobacterales bacterium]MBL7205157.1 iron-containing alcohol dehydrogenase [Desulfobacteraceae bacterium]
MTKFAVITDPKLGVKKLIIDPAIIATEAIVDPELTYSCPKHVTLVSGLDAMTHLIEGYFNEVDEGIDPQCNGRALAGLKLLFEALPKVVQDPSDKEGRRNMSLSSVLGGTVLFFKQAGGPHLNSFSWCNVMDHGEACAVMLPYYAAYYAPVVMEKLRNVSALMGLKDSGDPAKALWDRFEFVYTPKHGSWLNMAEIELNVLMGQCLNRRIDDIEVVRRESVARQEFRNNKGAKVNWQFTAEDARTKLSRLYPTLDD